MPPFLTFSKSEKVQNIYFWGCFLALKCFFSIFCPKLKFKIVSGKKTKKIKVYIFGILKWSKRGANMLQIKKNLSDLESSRRDASNGAIFKLPSTNLIFGLIMGVNGGHIPLAPLEIYFCCVFWHTNRLFTSLRHKYCKIVSVCETKTHCRYPLKPCCLPFSVRKNSLPVNCVKARSGFRPPFATSFSKQQL